MSERLAAILESARRRLPEGRARRSELERRARERGPALDLAAALRRPGRGTPDAAPLRVIGELKRRSPSAGSIREELDARAVGRELERAGCAALSVLTEPEFFGGSLETLAEVREAVALPLLRKDFLLEPWQVIEARAHGADAVLLLAAVLDDGLLRECQQEARRWGMSVLAEAHGEEELRRLLCLDLPVVGVNARDLRDFRVDLPAALRWIETDLGERVVVAESGIRRRADARRVARAPVDAALVGEGLMRPGTPAERFAELFGEGADDA